MATRRTKPIDLALQGGGAHGAFTWGVLDRLLEDERIEIAAIGGASAACKPWAAPAWRWAAPPASRPNCCTG